MSRRGTPAIAEPPWVWGPSEVREWIRVAHPSKRRRGGTVREGPDVVTRLRIVVEGSDVDRARAAMDEALGPIGLTLSASRARGARHRVAAVVRRSLVGERLHVSLRFAPPIHVSSCQRIVERIGEHVPVHAVSVHEERTRLPPSPR